MLNRSSIHCGIRLFSYMWNRIWGQKTAGQKIFILSSCGLGYRRVHMLQYAHGCSSSRCFLCVPLPLRCGIFPYRASFSSMYCDVLSTEVDSSSYWIAIYQSLKTNRTRLLCRHPCKTSFFSYTLIGIPRFLFNSVGDSILGREVSALEKLNFRILTAWTIWFSLMRSTLCYKPFLMICVSDFGKGCS